VRKTGVFEMGVWNAVEMSREVIERMFLERLEKGDWGV